MKKGKSNILVVDDSDMNCESTNENINKMNISNVGFSASILDCYDIVVYKGRKGCKILKAPYGIKTGIIVDKI
jgi:hypothetical protein